MMELQTVWHSPWKLWKGYWFRPVPLLNLAVCRIVIVAFQLYLMVREIHLDSLYKRSLLPDSLYEPLPILELLVYPLGANYRPSFAFLVIVFWFTLVAGIFALLGLKSNLSLIIFAIGNIFIQAYKYSFGDHHHPEALMMITLSVLALSPSGKVLSVDDLWRRLRRNIKRRRFEVFNITDEKSAFARWPLLLIQWMFALIYLDSALNKLLSRGLLKLFDWMNGYTLQYYLLSDGLRVGSDLGVWTSQYHTLARISSVVAILFEGTFFLVLLFPRLVWFYIPLGAAFHTGIYLAQRAPFFQYIAIYSVFIPWAAIVKTLSCRQKFSRSTHKPEVLYDGLCPLCIRSMTVLCYFDWFNRLTFSDLEERSPPLAKSHPQISLEECQQEMHLILPNGSIRKGFFAFREILWYLPPLWPLLVVFYLPLASTIGPKIYSFIASRRARFQRCSYDTCSIDSNRN